MSETPVPNQATLEKFLASVEKDAFRLARAATGDIDDALDLVQDTMLTLVQRYQDKSPDEWLPLFHRVLQNKIRDWYRRCQVRRIVGRFGQMGSGKDEASVPMHADEQPDIVAGSGIALTQLEAALAQLPLRQQQVFLLRIWQGMSVEETANAMSISTGSVKTHLSRSLAKLRAELEPDWRPI